MTAVRGRRAGKVPFVAAFAIGSLLGCGSDDPEASTEGTESSTSASTEASTSDGVESMGATGADGSTTAGTDGSELPEGGSWMPGAPVPTARQEVGVVALGGQIYVIGGFEGLSVIARVERYDPVADAWSRAADLPVPLHHPNVAVFDGRIVVAGFLTGVDFQADGRVFSYDPGQDDWSVGAPMPEGTQRGGGAAAALDGRVFVFGGLRGGTAVADASVYDVEAGTWAEIASLPEARDHLVAVTLGDRIVTIGGRAAAIGSHTPRVDLYDPAGDAWTVGAPMPTSRAGAAGAVLDGIVHVLGGEGADNESGVFDAHEAYDPVSDTWVELEPMQTPRHGTGAAVVDGRLFVPGGATTEAFGPTDVLEVWTPG